MQTITLLTLIVALFGSSCCSPIGAELFPGFYRNANLQAPQKEADINKRLAVEANPDAALKQISLQAFIGNLEQSLLQSAISVSGVNDQTQQVVPEVTPSATATSQPASTTTTESELTSEPSTESKTEHSISKRSTIAILDGTTSAVTTQTTPTAVSTTTSTPAASSSTPSTTPATEVSSTTDPNHVLLQTTKKVPQQDGIPAHILIDRISVQPHNGHIPLIPTFQVHHTKVITATVKDDNGTPNTEDDKTKKISITQTSIKSINVQSSKEEPTTTVKVDAVPETTTVVDSAEESTATSTQTAESVSTTAAGVTTEAQDNSTTAAATTTGTQTSAAAAATTTTTSTAKPLEELKHAEEDLKEKVAEIEAEPVILSARV